MSGFEQYIFELLVSYSTQPMIVYFSIVVLMTAGSFGLPVSEEVVLIAVGLIAFIGSNPDMFPHIQPSIQNSENRVTVMMAALVCFLSVYLSDIYVYLLGRFFSKSILSSTFFHRLVSKRKMDKISEMVLKHGYFYPAVFRFLPGLRFPGHFSSGLFRIPIFQFLFVDGLAAFLTIPTQVVLVGYFGRPIIEHLKEFILVLSLFCIVFILTFAYRTIQAIKKP